MKTPEPNKHDLEQKPHLQELHNKFLESQLVESQDKVANVNQLIDITECKLVIPVRINSEPGQYTSKVRKEVKDNLYRLVGVESKNTIERLGKAKESNHKVIALQQ